MVVLRESKVSVLLLIWSSAISAILWRRVIRASSESDEEKSLVSNSFKQSLVKFVYCRLSGRLKTTPLLYSIINIGIDESHRDLQRRMIVASQVSTPGFSYRLRWVSTKCLRVRCTTLFGIKVKIENQRHGNLDDPKALSTQRVQMEGIPVLSLAIFPILNSCPL
jgi:hypothetical protein